MQFLSKPSLLAFVLAASGCSPAGGGPSGDGPVCDLLDEDSDWISDGDEGSNDLDGDGVQNHKDDDSDDDGLFDAEEAGDEDACTPPNDTDDDGQYDFLDADSDGDGLTDRDEHEITRSDPTREDTDGDRYPDGVEALAGTDPNDPESRIPPDDFYLELPFEGAAQREQLAFGTNLEVADVFFLIDTSASMGPAIRNVQGGLLEDIVPALESAIPDLWIGVGEFEDFPVEPYGYDPDNPFGLPCDDRPFTLRQAMTADRDAIADALAVLDDPLGCGADPSESGVEALYQLATGAGLAPWIDVAAECPEDPDGGGPPVGAACFRPGAQPIVVLVSDATMHDGPGGWDPYVGIPGVAHYGDAASALLDVGARVVGVVVDEDPTVRAQMERIAIDTGTVDADNQPLVYDAPSGEAGAQVVDAVTRLVGATPQDISTSVEDDPEDTFDATGFIKAIRPAHAEPNRETDGSSFLAVPPGGTVWFEITFQNDLVEPGAQTRVYRAEIHVVGNGVAILDTRNVYVIVRNEHGTLDLE